MDERAGEIALRELLGTATVAELTLKVRLQLAPEDTISAAAALMRNRSHGCALVCRDDRLVGIFTERDLLYAIHDGLDLSRPLADVMTADPQTIHGSDSLWEAMRLMDTGGYRRLPVVDADGSPVGIVDVKAVTHFLVEHYPEAIYNQASRDQLTARHREGA